MPPTPNFMEESWHIVQLGPIVMQHMMPWRNAYPVLLGDSGRTSKGEVWRVAANALKERTIVRVEARHLKTAFGALQEHLRMNRDLRNVFVLPRLHAKTNFHLQAMLRRGIRIHILASPSLLADYSFFGFSAILLPINLCFFRK